MSWVVKSGALGTPGCDPAAAPGFESLERLEQGDLQLQIRLGESDRQFRRMATGSAIAIGQSVLLGCLALAAATARSQ